MNAKELERAEREFNLQICSTIYKQLQWPNRYVFFSWGAHNFESLKLHGNPALRFAVNGLIVKGHVVVEYNQGADAYVVYVYNKTAQLIIKQKDVYFNELQEVIDREIESGNKSKAEYETAVNDWFATL